MSCKKACCTKPVCNACTEARNQVTICQQGTATTQSIIQIGTIRYTSALPGDITLIASWNTISGIGEWRPPFQDSNGNPPPLYDQESYCVKNTSCRVAKFAIQIDGVEVLPPVHLEQGAFIAFTTDFASTTAPETTFGAACCKEEKPCCKLPGRVGGAGNYQGGRSPGLITCELPQKKRQIPFFRVAGNCSSCSTCN